MKQEPHYGDIDEDPAVHAGHLTRMGDYYARTAANYNTWHCDPANQSSHNFAVREILAVMQKTNSQTALDVCCGTGRAVKALLDHGYDARGLDFSPSLLEIGARDFQIPAERLTQGDATALPFADASFDVSCVLGALHHTARPRRLIEEMIRVTRHAIVVSDELNHLSGGIKQMLVAMGVFEPVYRLLFRREPRRHRRSGDSEGDGPTYVFSGEEIIPLLKSRFREFQCLTFYRLGQAQICSYRFPRLFARQGVITVRGKIAVDS